LQQYYGYAQQQYAIAAAGTPAGSRALYGLGKVHMTLARESSDDRSHQTPKAMAFFQAAMQADQRNHLAANELGVLLAQYGQLAEARRVLVHSVSMQSHAEGWQNLAVVHSRLGEQDLARKANYERELLLARSSGQPAGDKPVTWVAPREFNALGGPDAMAAAPAYAQPARPSNTTRR
jgi:predicted Zn-dependent protease